MKFFLQGLSLILLLGWFVFWFVSKWFAPAPVIVWSLAGGTVLACLFVASGFISYYQVRLARIALFGKVFITSAFIRLAICTLTIILLFKYTPVDRASFLISLCIWYFIFQIWEVLSFNRMMIGHKEM